MNGAYLDVAAHEACDRLRELDDLRVVDVRGHDEFDGELGHIPGAELVPLGGLDPALRRWDPGAPVLVVCRSGNRSARASRLLVAAGFERVYNLRGGMLAWNAHRFTVCGAASSCAAGARCSTERGALSCDGGPR